MNIFQDDKTANQQEQKDQAQPVEIFVHEGLDRRAIQAKETCNQKKPRRPTDGRSDHKTPEIDLHHSGGDSSYFKRQWSKTK